MVYFVFYVTPDIFNNVQIWALRRPRKNAHWCLFQEIIGNFGTMRGCIVLLEDKWSPTITEHIFYRLEKVILQDSYVFWSIQTILTKYQPAYAIRSNAPPKHDENWIFKGWLKISRIICLCACTPYTKGPGIIFQTKSAFMRKDNLLPLISSPVYQITGPSYSMLSISYWKKWLSLSYPRIYPIYTKNSPYMVLRSLPIMEACCSISRNVFKGIESQLPCPPAHSSFIPFVKFFRHPVRGSLATAAVFKIFYKSSRLLNGGNQQLFQF